MSEKSSSPGACRGKTLLPVPEEKLGGWWAGSPRPVWSNLAVRHNQGILQPRRECPSESPVLYIEKECKMKGGEELDQNILTEQQPHTLSLISMCSSIDFWSHPQTNAANNPSGKINHCVIVTNKSSHIFC